MRIFVTGATGWVGSAVLAGLLGAGHDVVGLCRSEEKAAELTAKGAEALLGTLDDLDRLGDAARSADAVVHLAFNHDFSTFEANSEQERRAIEAMGEALIGTEKPILVTSGLALRSRGRTAVEADMPSPDDPHFPRKNEAAAAALIDRRSARRGGSACHDGPRRR